MKEEISKTAALKETTKCPSCGIELDLSLIPEGKKKYICPNCQHSLYINKHTKTEYSIEVIDIESHWIRPNKKLIRVKDLIKMLEKENPNACVYAGCGHPPYMPDLGYYFNCKHDVTGISHAGNCHTERDVVLTVAPHESPIERRKKEIK